MIKLVAKQKIGFRNPETGEIVTAEPYAFSTLPDWAEKDPMYEWALADGTIEVASDAQENTDKEKAAGDAQEDKSKKPSGKKGDNQNLPQEDKSKKE